LGGNVTVKAQREHILYQASILKHNVEKALPLMASMIRRPLFSPENIRDAKQTTSYEILDQQFKMETVMSERLHKLAYGSTGLGNPLICSMEELEQISVDSVKRFWKRWYTPNRLIIAGAGVDHELLVSLTEQALGDMPLISEATLDEQRSLSLSSHYVGGTELTDSTHLPQSPNPDDLLLTHAYLGFEGLPANDPDIYALETIASLLGGGGSFSAGGPGKGMFTRLYQGILNRQYWVENTNNVMEAYSDSGLFGVCAAFTPHVNTHKAILPVLCDQLDSIVKKIQPEELSRAKNMLKSTMLGNMESKSAQMEDMARQLMIIDEHCPVTETCKRIDAVEMQDVIRVARRVLFGEPLTSRFKFGNKFIQRPSTGRKHPSLTVYGPFTGSSDPIYRADDVLQQWGFRQTDQASGRRWKFKL
jgi:processing peptidase subunit alpha